MKRTTRRGFFRRLVHQPVAVAGGIGNYLFLLFSSRNFYIGIALFTLFGVCVEFFDFEPPYLVVTFMLVMVEVLLIVIYIRPAMLAMITNPIQGQDVLLLGIWLAWTVDFLTRVWAITQRYTQDSGWMQTSHLLTLLLFGKLIAAVLHITAPDAENTETKVKTRVLIAAAFVLGAFTATLLLYLAAGKPFSD